MTAGVMFEAVAVAVAVAVVDEVTNQVMFLVKTLAPVCEFIVRVKSGHQIQFRNPGDPIQLRNRVHWKFYEYATVWIYNPKTLDHSGFSVIS
jgi:hypothetical protein